MSKKILIIIPSIILISVSLYFIYITGINVRYWADDFCSAALLNKAGFFNTQISLWTGWTGRYSATFFIALLELTGPWIVRIFPFLMLIFLLASLKRFYRINKILPVIFIFLVLINTPNIIQTFYWQTGSLNYLAPFILLNIFLGLVVFPPKKTFTFIPFSLSIIAGGFSEAFGITQLILMFSILTIVKFTEMNKKEERIKIIISGIAGAFLSLVIMYVAPGNSVRALSVNHPESIKFVIVSTFYTTKWYLLRMMSIKPFIYSLIFIFTSVIVLTDIRLKKRQAIITGIAAILTSLIATAAVIGSGYYSMAIIPPERALFVAVYIMLLCFVAFSFAVRSLIKFDIKFIWLLTILNFIFTFFLVKSVINYWTSVHSEVRTYAQGLDNIDKNSPLVKNIPPAGGLDSFTDNGGWVGQCVSGYYKIPMMIK